MLLYLLSSMVSILLGAGCCVVLMMGIVMPAEHALTRQLLRKLRLRFWAFCPILEGGILLSE